MVQKAAPIRATRGRPVGNVTRGTTNPNRMRRVDRWITGAHARRLRSFPGAPLAVDLGYGASPTTALELFDRLRAVREDFRLTGVEIEPTRVAAAKPLERDGLDFRLGGFELSVAEPPALVRAFNVLRQYEEGDVGAIWELVCSRLAPGGLFVEGTCDEIGRRAAWVALDADGPRTLSVAVRFGSFERPSDVAERLPKALIHRNVPGEPVYDFLQALDGAWLAAASLAPFGNRQRWIAMARAMRESGWPLADGPARWRLGELTVAWGAVAPHH
ncbi:class I SAM-dependent methyltransferase [Sinomonas sp. ASV322]|uniref:class I SAM-dependent methyltransferase n=1 Tax=Sinomonas sp. ASV322 TaxID=3041920 RepID=UPI0027DB1F24|nr:class I SAM-dependent methyltransferase [Sinomonas sp. ASV322]MDQ4503851.1 class I SAM-dependent methyltransferase [Sinomonas sp. ASV322]